jgi:hypothetical protein
LQYWFGITLDHFSEGIGYFFTKHLGTPILRDWGRFLKQRVPELHIKTTKAWPFQRWKKYFC